VGDDPLEAQIRHGTILTSKEKKYSTPGFGFFNHFLKSHHLALVIQEIFEKPGQ
jgi:hypothetical protein